MEYHSMRLHPSNYRYRSRNIHIVGHSDHIVAIQLEPNTLPQIYTKINHHTIPLRLLHQNYQTIIVVLVELHAIQNLYHAELHIHIALEHPLFLIHICNTHAPILVQNV